MEKNYSFCRSIMLIHFGHIGKTCMNVSNSSIYFGRESPARLMVNSYSLKNQGH